MNAINLEELFPARPCPVCADTQHEVLLRHRFATFSEGSLLAGYNIVACRRCGAGFADRIPPQQVFDAYYRDMSKYENNVRLGLESPTDQKRFADLAERIARRVPDRNARIVEIGCATGGLLAALKALGYANLLGIDPSPACAEAAERLHGVKALAGTVSQLPPSIGKFDVVILFAVIEHLPGFDALFAAFDHLTEEGGGVYIGVPDAAKLSYSSDAPYQEFSVEHVNYFCAQSLTNLMQTNRYAAVDLEQFEMATGPSTSACVLSGFFKRTDRAQAFNPETETIRSLRAYIDQSAQRDKPIHQYLDDLARTHSRIVVWGAGALTLRLLAGSPLSRVAIESFVDSNPRYKGKTINGVPVISPAELPGGSTPILIMTKTYEVEIRKQIQERWRLPNPVLVLPIT